MTKYCPRIADAVLSEFLQLRGAVLIEGIKWCGMIINQEFSNAESFLLREIERNPEDYKANSTLADLYCTKAIMLNRKAVHYGKAALALKAVRMDDELF